MDVESRPSNTSGIDVLNAKNLTYARYASTQDPKLEAMNTKTFINFGQNLNHPMRQNHQFHQNQLITEVSPKFYAFDNKTYPKNRPKTPPKPRKPLNLPKNKTKKKS